MKYFIAVHKNNYTEDNIMDMVNPINIKHIYSPQTYWEPGEDYLEFDVEYNKNFDEVVKPIEIHFFEENEDCPYAAIINGITYCFNYAEDWEEILNDLGWKLFYDLPLSEEYVKDEKEVKTIINDWAYGLCVDKAWEIIENDKYGDY